MQIQDGYEWQSKYPERRYPHPCFTQCLFGALTLAVLYHLGHIPSARAALEDELIRVRMESSAIGTGLPVRNAAVKNAEHAVLVQVLESIVGEGAMPKVASLLEQPSRYVYSTRVLRHEQSAGTTTVEIETFVRRKALETQAAELLARRLPWPPKALVLVAERIGKDGAFSVAEDGVGQTALSEALHKNHIAIADRSALRERYSDADLIGRVQGDLEVARQFAQENLVDVVLLGEAIAETELSPSGANVYRNKATVTVRLIRARDGKLLEAIAQESVVHSANPAEGGAQAIQDACTKLRHAITVRTVLAAVGAGPRDDVILTIKDLGSRARLDEVMRVLSESAGVEAVEELYCAEAEACLRVKYNGPMAPFVDNLTLRDYPGFSLEAQRVVARDMTVCVVEL